MSGFPGMKTYVVLVQYKKRGPFEEAFRTRAFDKAQAKKKAVIAGIVDGKLYEKLKVEEDFIETLRVSDKVGGSDE